jgi:serine/threonine protein kinase
MRTGDQLGGRYRLIGELGRGGHGVVWEAYDQRLGRQVAVRTGCRESAGVRGSGAVLRLDHPNIVLVLDLGEAVSRDGERCDYLVMELLNGLTLRQALADGRPELARALDWARQLCAGLAAAHGAGVVHGDVKPENLMFTAPDRTALKVLDFGLGRPGERTDGPDAPDAPDIPEGRDAPDAPECAGSVERTDAAERAVADSGPYLAPERWYGAPGSVRADLYAVGCVLHELLTGTRPFTAAGDALMTQHRDEPPPRLPALPAGLAELVAELLAKDPAERPDSAAAVAGRLDTALTALRELRRRVDTAFRAAGDGRIAEAIDQLLPLISQFGVAFGPDDARALRTCHELAAALARLGRPDEAYCLLAELLPMATAALGDGHPEAEAIQRRLARSRLPERPCPPGLLAALLGAVDRAGG